VDTSRRTLRRWVAGEIGELITGTGTSAGGNTSTFKDAVTFQIPDSELQGREAWYVSSANPLSAANVGTLRIVSDNDEGDTSISVAPAWPAEPQTGDVIELFNARGYSVSVLEIHDKLNQLIQEVSEEGAIAEASSSSVMTWQTPDITAPDDWIWLYGAEYADSWGTWRMIHPADIVPRTWDSPVTVRIKDASFRLALNYGGTVHLIGAPALSQLNDDTDVTSVDAAWLVRQTAAEVQRAAALRWGDAATALAISNIELAEAEKRRPRVTDTHPNTGKRWRLR
jgi:hypothetical protein